MPKGAFTDRWSRSTTTRGGFRKSYKHGMRVDGLIFADDTLIEQIRNDQAPEQVANVAFLPGIQMASLAMPDIHWGYGFCIGGVCATDPERRRRDLARRRRLRHQLRRAAGALEPVLSTTCKPHLTQLVDELFRHVPTGVGRGGKYRFDAKELRQLMGEGVGVSVERAAWPTDGDIEHTEARGRLDGAEPDTVSDRALERGGDQCGTLGSGNHFLEVQVVDRRLRRARPPRVMGLEKDMVCVMIHSGSRGLGYQVCDDALHALRERAGEVRHRAARPAARLRPGRQPRRAALHRRDARGGELRLVQPPAADVAGPRGASRRSSAARWQELRHEPGLRRGPQHRQVRGAHDRRRQAKKRLGPPQGRDAGLPAGPSGSAARCTARSASR